MKNWHRLGLIFKPNSSQWWMKTHAMIPTPEHLEGSRYRIYFSGRDDQNRSQIGYFVIDLKDPTKIIEVTESPVLSPGRLGCFDDNGVTPSCIVRDGAETLLYYIGWNPGSTTRMNLFGGLAVSSNGGKTFKRYSEAPIIERNQLNPFINTAPFVIKESKRWIMYYIAGVEWVHKDLPRYHIQVAHSTNGREWSRQGQVVVDFEKGENALARPYVFFHEGVYKMIFASKGEAYRLQYAESTDGVSFKRMPNAFEFPLSPTGFDSQMIEYAAIVKWNHQNFMFYNGNDYGKEGIGLAVCPE